MTKGRRREVSRVEGFSDAVFGFAVTLLVVSLEVPRTFDELLLMMRGLPAFAVSFAMLFQIWWRHYRFFRRYDLEDGHVIALTAMLLFVVLFYVYPLKFLWSIVFAQLNGARTAVRLPGRQAWQLFVIYGAGCTAAFGILAAMYRHAYVLRDELELTPLEIADTKVDVYRNVALAGIGMLSMAVAVAAGLWTPGLTALAGFVYFLVPVSEWTLGVYQGRLRRRTDMASSVST